MKKFLFAFIVLFLFVTVVGCKEEKVEEPVVTDPTQQEPTRVVIWFNTNGGNELAPITKMSGQPITAPYSPIREGYLFEGWYTDEALTNKFEFTTMPNATITLYAKWIDNSYEGLTFLTFANNTCYVKGYIGTSESVTIPTTFKGYTVIGIAQYAFSGNTTVKTVSFAADSKVTLIAQGAFKNATELTTVNLPKSLVVIDVNAFEGATKLTTVTFEEGSLLQEIGGLAFAKTTSLTSINLPVGITISETAFNESAYQLQ